MSDLDKKNGVGDVRPSSKKLFNRLAEAMLLHLERNLVNKHKCGEIVAKQQTAKVDSPIQAAVKNLNSKFGVAMKDVVEDAFKHFDADLSNSLNSEEVEEFLTAYLSWINKDTEPLWNVLQKPRLVNIINVFASTLCASCDRKDILREVQKEFLKIVDFKEFKEATKQDVTVMSKMIKKNKTRIVRDLIHCCDKDKDGLLSYDEFVTCANLDFIQRLTREEDSSSSSSKNNSQSHYSALWHKKSSLLIEKFCAMSESSNFENQEDKVDEGVPRPARHGMRKRSTTSEVCSKNVCMTVCVIS